MDQNFNTCQVATSDTGQALAVVRDTDLYASEDWGVSLTMVREAQQAVNAILTI